MFAASDLRCNQSPGMSAVRDSRAGPGLEDGVGALISVGAAIQVSLSGREGAGSASETENANRATLLMS